MSAAVVAYPRADSLGINRAQCDRAKRADRDRGGRALAAGGPLGCGRMLRTFGYLPLWLLAAIALALNDRESREWWRRAALLAAAPTASGIFGELLKITVRRLRPSDDGSSYHFRAFGDHPFSSRGLGFPSSHAIVAFGAAAILARLFPRARVVWYAAAVGCAVSRLLAHAHYLSDVVAAACVGIGVGALLWNYGWLREA